MASNEKIIIYNFTDPVCTWCLGMEPIFRKLEVSYPELVEIRYVMGGLVKDFRDMADPMEGIRSEDALLFNRQVAKHWEHASLKHGMPVKAEGFSLFSEDYPSTYPQNIAYKAAQMADAEKADFFLYLMRTGVSSGGLIISKEEVQVKLAEEAGIERASFLKYLRDGSAEAAFEEDLITMRRFGIRGFPSFILEYKVVNYALHGFSPFSVFHKAIQKITEGKETIRQIERSYAVLKRFLHRHPKIAAEELKQVFEFNTQEEVKTFVLSLIEDGSAILTEAGNSWFLQKV